MGNTRLASKDDPEAEQMADRARSVQAELKGRPVEPHIQHYYGIEEPA